MRTIEDVKTQVAALTAEEQQLLKDCILYGSWGDAEFTFYTSQDSEEMESVSMDGYCTNDAKDGGHFQGRQISALFRNIYQKMCRGQKHTIGYVLSHCRDWWDDGSGDMLFIRGDWSAAFEQWARE